MRLTTRPGRYVPRQDENFEIAVVHHEACGHSRLLVLHHAMKPSDGHLIGKCFVHVLCPRCNNSHRTPADYQALTYILEEWGDIELFEKVSAHMSKTGENAEGALDAFGISCCYQCNYPVPPDRNADSGHGPIHMECAGPAWSGA